MRAAPDSLISLQKIIGTTIRTPLHHDDDQGLQAQDAALAQEAVDLILDSKQLPARGRLRAYNEQYWYRLLDSLEEDLPVLRQLMGAHEFHECCTAFLSAYPSIYYTLRDLPLRLPQFLQEDERWNKKLYQQVADHGLIHVQLFDSGELPALDPTQLEPEDAAALANTPLEFQPAWFLFKEDWNINQIDEAIAQEAEIPPLTEQTGYWAFYRQHNRIRQQELSPVSYQLLQRLSAGDSISSACSTLEQSLPPEQLLELGEHMQTWFQNWVSHGWFVHPH